MPERKNAPFEYSVIGDKNDESEHSTPEDSKSDAQTGAKPGKLSSADAFYAQAYADAFRFQAEQEKAAAAEKAALEEQERQKKSIWFKGVMEKDVIIERIPAEAIDPDLQHWFEEQQYPDKIEDITSDVALESAIDLLKTDAAGAPAEELKAAAENYLQVEEKIAAVQKEAVINRQEALKRALPESLNAAVKAIRAKETAKAEKIYGDKKIPEKAQQRMEAEITNQINQAEESLKAYIPKAALEIQTLFNNTAEEKMLLTAGERRKIKQAAGRIYRKHALGEESEVA